MDARVRAAEQAVNEVRLVGRVSQPATERQLPSGDVLCTFRLIVHRDGPVTARSRQTVDVVDCTVWSGRLRRSVGGWRPGDLVELTGALRRRFFRSTGATGSRVEVEVAAARLIRRAASA